MKKETLHSRTVLTLLAALVGLCTFQSSAAMPERDRIDAGRQAYDYFCYQCHGYNGDGKTVAARSLGIRPRDFTSTDPGELTRQSMIRTVTHGKADTPMRSFARVLKDHEIEAVVDYIRSRFMAGRGTSFRYHTAENGWRDHSRYSAAFPFVSGTLPLDTPWEDLDAVQREGRRLFISACITCHEGSRRDSGRIVWEREAISYPRSTESCDGCHESSRYLHDDSKPPFPTPGSRHGTPPVTAGLSDRAREGRALYLRNCAFCHAADATGANWIGTFLRPHPRNLSRVDYLAGVSDSALLARIREGVAGTSMPAWKSLLNDAEILAIVRYLRESAPAAGQPAVVERNPALSGPAPRATWRRATP